MSLRILTILTLFLLGAAVGSVPARAQTPASHVVVTVDQADTGLYLIDGSTFAVVGPLLVGELGFRSSLLDLAFTPDGRTALGSNFAEARLYFIDFNDLYEPEAQGLLNLGFLPEDIVVTPDGRYAIISTGVRGSVGLTILGVVDLENRTLVARQDIRPKAAQAVTVSPDGRTVLVMEWHRFQSSSLHLFGFDPQTGALEDLDRRVDVGVGALNVEIDPAGETVLVMTTDSGLRSFRFGADGFLTATGTIEGISAQSVAFSPDGTEAYVLDVGASPDQLIVFDVAGAGRVIDTGVRIPLARDASQAFFLGVDVIAVTGDGMRAYVGASGEVNGRSGISVVDLESRTMVATVPAGTSPLAVAVNTAYADGENIAVATELALPVGATGRGEAARLRQPVDVAAEVDGPFEPTQRTLHYRRGGDSTFQHVEMTAGDDGYVATIPGDLVDLVGVEYFIELSDGERTATYPALRPDAFPANIRVQVDQWPLPEELTPGRYDMISVPLELDGQTARAVLEDDLGAYVPEAWRLYRWTADRQAYVPLPDLEDAVRPGAAYWVASRDRARIDVDDALSVFSNGRYDVALQPGWNQIGNPFAFPVAWNRIEGSDRVEPPVGWNGVEYEYATSTLVPWAGYFVYNPQPDSVVLRVPARASVGATDGIDAAQGYTVRLAARVTSEGWQDTRNRIGFAEGTEPVRRREAPPVGRGVRLTLVDGGGRWAEDVRPASPGGATWDLELVVDADLRDDAARIVDLSYVESGVRPEGHELYVLDLEGGARLMPNGDGVALRLEPDRPRRLRVVVGPRSLAEAESGGIPLDVPATALDPAYPNPFVRTVTLPYRLSERGEVRLAVFDALGRRVRTLTAGVRPAGIHQVDWDGADDAGRPAASGLYLVRLETDTQNFMRTVTLSR